MDLKSLMNNDSAEAARPTQSIQHRESVPPPQHSSIRPPPPRTASGSYGSPQQQHNAYAPKPAPPLYQHSSVDSRASNGAIPPPRLTPLHTPVQNPGQIPVGGAAGYPFPTGPYQSPSQPQQYRGPDPYPVVTPGGSRPPAPLYQHNQQVASSPYGAPQPPAGLRHSASHPSMSPTPPSMHQQTPQPARESSMSATQPYGHQQYSMHQQHPSQPSTPLGPPSSVQYPRPFAQGQSPYSVHHRTSSGASHGPPHSVASNSPAQAMSMSMSNVIGSPATHHQQGPPGHATRVPSGGYIVETERERSVSVSPKTRVIPRQGSQGSYYSSHDSLSARNSLSACQPENDRLSHQTQSQPQHEVRHLRSSGDMSHGISPLTTTRPPPNALQPPPAPSPSSRSSQTPKLVNILNDSSMAPSPVRQSPVAGNNNLASRHSPQTQLPASNGARPLHNAYDVRVKAEPPSLVKTEGPGFPRESLLQQPVTAPAHAPLPAQEGAMDRKSQSAPLKRSAETEPESAHPVKRAKKRYAVPPVWARYHKSNPNYGDNPQSLAPPPQPLQHQLAKRPSPHPQARSNHSQQGSVPPTNGHTPQPMANGTPAPHPGGVPPQVPHRFGQWEPNVRNVQLMNDLTKDIGDFLFHHATRNDIGVGDVRSGVLEVEAKLGTLIDRNTNSRVSTMGVSNMVLDHAVTSSGRLRFESFMTELQHKQMNEFLNKAVQASMEQGRVKMGYKHRYERDSFAPLNRAGIDALPTSAKELLHSKHAPKLRTSVDTRAPKGSPQAILGRIVKVRLDDLDIHCPKMDFDCRISVNVEVDLNNRADIDPSLIVEAINPGDPEAAPDRMKDRLSYQHLAYSIDLTQVTGAGGKKSHELEIEVDTAKLREEAVRLVNSQESAYEALVDGMLSNIFTLMKASKEMGQHGR